MNFNLNVSDAGLKVSDSECWCCGCKVDITDHHAINKHLKPLKNVVVPLCVDCHKAHNSQDMLGLKNFAYKIFATTKNLVGQVGALKSLLQLRRKVKK